MILSDNKESKKIIFHTKKIPFKKIFNEKPFSIFDQTVIKLFGSISESIFKIKDLKKFPDLATFAFFCRSKNLKNFRQEYRNHINSRSGRGLALHFTPSNVPLNFAYSLLFSLITGNVTIIRLGKNKSEQSSIFLKILNKVIKHRKFIILRRKIAIVNYTKNENINNYLSENCQIRVLWGGDQSIEQIRNSRLKPDAFELTFPDRTSICIISSKYYLDFSNYKYEALNFYKDTMTFDQNACTSPRLIVWVGAEKVNKIARKVFWENFNKVILEKNYSFNEKMAIDKITAQHSSAISLNGKNNFKNKYIKNSLVNFFPTDFSNYKVPGGFFLEFNCKKIDFLKKYMTTKIQTVTTIGFSNLEIKKKLKVNQSKGIFRIVDNGKSSDMGLVWDGYEIIFQMSKKIVF